MKYTVSVTRVTHYDVDADTQDEAIDKVLDGEGAEVDGQTLSATAELEQEGEFVIADPDSDDEMAHHAKEDR